ncbi:MAG: hypothetical protein MUC57_15570 [Desulfobacterales bacterium]|nr:hypothetical protein [Desulfobacterales bacterium]
MKRFQWLVLGLGVLGMLIPGFSWAQHSHGHGSGAGSMKMDTREVLVEGIKVTFQIMANAEHRKMLKDMKMKDDIEPGSTHNVTVVLTDPSTQKEIVDAAVSMRYELLVLLKTGDQKRTAGISYELK